MATRPLLVSILLLLCMQRSLAQTPGPRHPRTNRNPWTRRSFPVVVLLLLVSFVPQVRSWMPCTTNADCEYDGCKNSAPNIYNECTFCYNGPSGSTGCNYNCGGGCGNSLGCRCAERPCPAGTYQASKNSVCISNQQPGAPGTWEARALTNGLGRGGGTDCTCDTCPVGTYSMATGATLCTSCGPGTYSTAVGASASSTCIACPFNSTSPAGSAALTNCTCNAGSTGPNGGPCTACVAGKYKTSIGSAACITDPLANILSLNPAYLIASAESWDSSQNRFMDPSGNGRVGTLQAGAVSIGSVTGNGATWPVPYVGGTTGTQISWGAASIPSTFTICSITRYSGAVKDTILRCKDGKDDNWIHGHWNSYAGATHYGELAVPNSQYGPGELFKTISPNTNWVVACGRNIQTTGSAGTIINGVVTSTAEGGYGGCKLAINPQWPSDWQLSKVYVWNTHLPDAVFTDASARLNTYLEGAVTVRILARSLSRLQTHTHTHTHTHLTCFLVRGVSCFSSLP
jgi:hypothetical protein